MAEASGTGRTGRRPGKQRTRGELLEAARRTFAERGYDGTTVREVAARAGVDARLVAHYFGSKAELFREVVRFPLDPAQALPVVLGGGLDGLGTRLVGFFLETLDSAEGQPALGLLRSALTTQDATALLREFVRREVVGRVARALPADRPETRAALAGSQLVGLAVARYIVALPPLSTAAPSAIAEWVGPALQRYLTDPSLFRSGTAAEG